MPLSDDQVIQMLADGNDSEVEDFADNENEIVPRVLDHLEESGSGSNDESTDEIEAPPTTTRSRGSTSGRSGRRASARGRGRVTGSGQARRRGQSSARSRELGTARGQARRRGQDRGRGQAGVCG